MKKLSYEYGGFILIALAFCVTVVAFMVTNTSIDGQASQGSSVSLGFFEGAGNLLCLGCVKAMKKEAADDAVRRALNKIRKKVRKALVWPFGLIVLSLFYEIWRFRRSRRNCRSPEDL